MKTILFLNLVLAPLTVCGASPRAATKPNVIVIMTDDQGYGEIAAHGNPIIKTPHLDQLCTTSVRLTDFHVDPTCSPTRPPHACRSPRTSHWGAPPASAWAS